MKSWNHEKPGKSENDQKWWKWTKKRSLLEKTRIEIQRAYGSKIVQKWPKNGFLAILGVSSWLNDVFEPKYSGLDQNWKNR